MDRILNMFSNRSVRRFTAASLLCMLLCALGGWALAEKQARQNVRLLQTQQLQIAGKLESSMPEAREQIRSAMLEERTAEDLARGEALLGAYGLRITDTSPKTNQTYQIIRKQLLTDLLLYGMTAPLLLFLLAMFSQSRILLGVQALTAACRGISAGKAPLMSKRIPDGDLLVCGLELQRLYDACMHFKQIMQREKEQLRQRMQDISHQMKTPLSVIKLNLELLLEHPDMPLNKKTGFWQTNLKELSHMEWLISNQLKLARLEAGVVEYNLRLLPVGDTCRSVWMRFRQTAVQQDTELFCNVPKEILLWHDPAWLSEALTNLVKNALEHTKGGRVEITGEETPMTVQLTIRDNGSGISPAERAALFERFNRHSSALSEASTGIGLSIAKRITEDQGGELILEPNSDRGCCFHLCFLKKQKP